MHGPPAHVHGEPASPGRPSRCPGPMTNRSAASPSSHRTAAPTDPRVSVILLTYQQREFIEEAIRSVLDQTYPNVELLIVDNGSTDGTRELLTRYAHTP